MITSTKETEQNKMKKLTKAFFKKEIKNAVKTGMTSLQAMESLMNEYEMYAMTIIDAHTAVMMEAL